MDAPHGLRAFLNELFGVRRTPASKPATPPLEVSAPPKPCAATVLPAISEDAVVVAKGETATGPLEGEGDYDVQGSLDGGIRTSGAILVTGLVRGPLTGASIEVRGGELCGDLAAAGTILIDGDGLVIGALSADVVDVAGRVKGDIRAKSRALFRGTAVLTGDIEAASVIIEPGAAIDGKVHLTD
ncbi:MAG TPA: polymer-forming cytoskeletal protein [Candidatus Acidoferrum sp.]|nr:polymer-forming cytoskeletal protein [Candidatus Acidoferrum sp.]